MQQIVIVIILAFVCYIISTIIHELGHILCGIFHKWRLFLLVIGPIKLYRNDLKENLKIGIEKNPSLWAGVGGTFPTKKSEENIKIWGRILLTGPIVSLIFGFASLILYCIFTYDIFLLFACISIGMGFMCIIPTGKKAGMFYNDGTRYRRIKQGGQAALEERALFKILEIDMIDGENSNYPVEYIKPLIESEDYELKYSGHYYLYLNAKNNNDLDEKMKQIQNMNDIKKKVSKLVIDSCIIEK